jgi:uncharacterized protein YkwD
VQIDNDSVLLVGILSVIFLIGFSGLFSVFLFDSPINNYQFDSDESPQDIESNVDDFNSNELEDLIHRRVNYERRKRGLDSLSFDEDLSNISYSHSYEMAKNNYLSHTNIDGQDVASRYNEYGYDCRVKINSSSYSVGGENILYTYYNERVKNDNGYVKYKTMDGIARGAVRQWINSKEHRINMFRGYWNKQGIGVYKIDNKVYVTQNFC